MCVVCFVCSVGVCVCVDVVHVLCVMVLSVGDCAVCLVLLCMHVLRLQ